MHKARNIRNRLPRHLHAPTRRALRQAWELDDAEGLSRNAPRGRAFASTLPEQIAAVVERTLHDDPPAATHWTLRSMGKASSLAPSTIHRIWREHGLKPHRVETFKLSNDPKFVEKVREPQATPEGRYIVGLYVNPPEHALVLSVDEKSQIQALDRTIMRHVMSRHRRPDLSRISMRLDHRAASLAAPTKATQGNKVGWWINLTTMEKGRKIAVLLLTQLRGKPCRSGQGRIAQVENLFYNNSAADTQGGLRQGMPEVKPVEIRAAVGRSAQEPTETTTHGSIHA